MEKRILCILLTLILSMIFITPSIYAVTPYVDSGYDIQQFSDTDLFIVREVNQISFISYSNGSRISDLGGTITFPSFMTITGVDPTGTEYPDLLNWDAHSIDFYLHFAMTDDFKVYIDYGNFPQNNAYFDISLTRGSSSLYSDIEYSAGIQVGNAGSLVYGAGDYGEVTDIRVPLAGNPPVAPEPISSVLFLAGGVILMGKYYFRKRSSGF